MNDNNALMSDEELAKLATSLGAAIIAEYVTEKEFSTTVVGLGAMHAAIYCMVQAGMDKEDIVGFASDHYDTIERRIWELYDELKAKEESGD